jgi:predicted metal-binding membrane protein
VSIPYTAFFSSLLEMPTPLPRRDRVLLAFCLVAITALSWVYLIHLAREMSASMAEMDTMAKMGMPMDTPWTMSDVLLTFAMWAVMMVGMMTASAIPAVIVMAKSRAARGESGVSLITLTFAAGYLLVWIGFSAGAAIAQWALHEQALLSSAMKASSPWLAGGLLIVAGIYQWTALKQSCLSHCRSPFDFLITRWRSGWSGALEMGVHHGVYCVGCCWALMALLFAVGVMNLLWVALLAALVLVEKATPAGVLISRVAGVGLVAAGIAYCLL